MESIQRTLGKMMNKEGFKERYNQLKNDVLKNPHVRAFIIENKDSLTEEMIEKSMGKLYEFTTQTADCNQCPSLDECPNLMQGYEPHLVISGKIIDIHYDRCKKKKHHDDKRKHSSLIQSMHMPDDILHAKMEEVELDANRLTVVKEADEFIQTYKPGDFSKGLFIYGPFGVGKTYILGAIANELAEKNIQSMLVYTPEFLREMKSSLADQSINKKLDAIKSVPILMMDDIGAESMSSWMRDDILGPILQYRMMNKLPTFLSSNFSYSELEHHLSYTQRGEVEKLKAARIMERIKYLTKPLQLNGENRRL
jgi:primosomal protein DnaI